jgi:hypothetical protein
VKFDNSFVRKVAEILAVSPHFHGQFAACGDGDRVVHPGSSSSLVLFVNILLKSLKYIFIRYLKQLKFEILEEKIEDIKYGRLYIYMLVHVESLNRY